MRCILLRSRPGRISCPIVPICYRQPALCGLLRVLEPTTQMADCEARDSTIIAIVWRCLAADNCSRCPVESIGPARDTDRHGPWRCSQPSAETVATAKATIGSATIRTRPIGRRRRVWMQWTSRFFPTRLANPAQCDAAPANRLPRIIGAITGMSYDEPVPGAPVTMKRIAITGSSGYVGVNLVDYFLLQQDKCEVLGIDWKSPVGDSSWPDQFVQLDVGDPSLVDIIAAFDPDTIVHAAFVIAPMHDERKMSRINIGAVKNVLAAAERVKPARLHLVSSATAFGAWPENPVPLAETACRRPSHFQYAADKCTMEMLASEFARQVDQTAVSWSRPAIIGGPGMDNYLRRLIFELPILARFDGVDSVLQFVHEDDVTSAIVEILRRDARGGFNVAPDDWISVSQLGEETDRRVISLPLWLARLIHRLGWFLRSPIHETPASFLDFARYPWVVASSRLTEEFGFRFQHTGLETVRAVAKLSKAK